MGVGIRTEDLRKVDSSPPPSAAGAAGFAFVAARARGSKDGAGKKAEVVALDGLSLDVQPGEVAALKRFQHKALS